MEKGCDNCLVFKSSDEKVHYIKEQLPNVNITLLESQEDNEEAWLAQRNNGVGGSDVGAICGLSQFESPLGIYLKKTDQYSEEDSSQFKKDLFHFGHVLEDIVASEYNLRTGQRLFNAGVSFASKKEPWKLANVDRFILDDKDNIVGILEVKTTSAFNNSSWSKGDVPLSYLAQLNWYLHVLDLQYGAICVLVGGNRFYSFEFFRNDEWLNNFILPTVDKFWNVNVQNLKEPDYIGSDAEEELINKLYPASTAKNNELQLDNENVEVLLKEFDSTKKKIKSMEKYATQISNKLKSLMGDYVVALTPIGKIQWKPQTQNRIDTKLLQAEYPDIARKVTKQVQFRKFTYKIEGEEE